MSPNRVQAAFLRNFSHYVSWPAGAFTDGSAAWNIGVLGPDPFGQVLEETFQGRMEQGRAYQVYRANVLEELPPCQIVFIAYADAAPRRAALRELRTRSVLTVGDAPDFLKEGGIIRLQTRDHVEMSINLDQARAVSLAIPTKMLEVTREVVENGTVHRQR